MAAKVAKIATKMTAENVFLATLYVLLSLEQYLWCLLIRLLGQKSCGELRNVTKCFPDPTNLVINIQSTVLRNVKTAFVEKINFRQIWTHFYFLVQSTN
jgi:hypothetical protein